MWREVTNLAKRYYEGDKKYTTRVFRNTKIQWEMNIAGVFHGEQATFMIVLYPLKNNYETLKQFGPITVKLFVPDRNALDGVLRFIKENINDRQEDINKIYNSELAKYIVE